MIDLTPLEVRKKKSDFRRVMRGYDPGLVDDFLDLVADRLDELVRENTALNERTSRQEQQVSDFRDREQALTDALVTAQEMREEIRRQTTLEAELARKSAEQEAAQLRATSTQEATLLRSTAEQEVARLRATAAEEVAQLRARVQAEVTQLRTTAQQEAQELRSTARQERERDEEALRRLRAQQQQFLAQYHSFLERELSELRLSAEAMGVAVSGAARGAVGGAVAGVTDRSSQPIQAPQPEIETAESAPATLAEADAPFMVRLGSLESADALESTASVPDMVSRHPLEANDGSREDGGAALDPGLLDEEAMLLAPLRVPGATAAEGFMFPDDPIEDDELSFVDALEPFEPEPFEPEPFEPEPFEPEPYDEPERFEVEGLERKGFEPDSFAREPREAEPREQGAYTAEWFQPAAEEAGRSDVAPVEESTASDEVEVRDDGLVLYDALSAEADEDGVPGPVGLGGALDEPPGWATAPAWTIQGVDLVQDSTLSAELPDPPAPFQYDDVGGDDGDGEDEDASEILRNAAAAGYRLPELDDFEELLLDEAVPESGERDEESSGDDSDGWLPTLLDDDR
jgi:cell division initiation protein